MQVEIFPGRCAKPCTPIDLARRLQSVGVMLDRRTLDQRPGSVPDIRMEGDSVGFVLDVTSEHARLVIRCAPDGSVRASIADWQQQGGRS